MRTASLLLALVASTSLGQTVYKNGGTRLGTAVFVDCSADAGVNCTRTAATGTVNVRCSSASATEPGCVSIAAQTFAGTKTVQGLVQAQGFDAVDGGSAAFTAGLTAQGVVRGQSFGGADGGLYVKLSDGTSLVSFGSFSAYDPALDIGIRDETTRLVGVLQPLGQSFPGAFKVHSFSGLHTTVGTDDGGVNPLDGGDMIFTAAVFAGPTDGGTGRNVCSFESGCNYGGGSFPVMPYDATCGMDGGGYVDKAEFLWVVVNDGNCWVNPGVNYTVVYTGPR